MSTLNENDPCPRCGRPVGRYPALSRRDNSTNVCSDCGTTEALEDFARGEVSFTLEVEDEQPLTAEEKLANAIDAFFHSEASDSGHYFSAGFDGDGWNEPYSADYKCSCGNWSLSWVQKDRKQSDYITSAQALLQWMEHFDSSSTELI